MPIGIYNSKTYDMFEMIDSTNPHNLYDMAGTVGIRQGLFVKKRTIIAYDAGARRMMHSAFDCGRETMPYLNITLPISVSVGTNSSMVNLTLEIE
jgi:hypothetical protein